VRKNVGYVALLLSVVAVDEYEICGTPKRPVMSAAAAESSEIASPTMPSTLQLSHSVSASRTVVLTSPAVSNGAHVNLKLCHAIDQHRSAAKRASASGDFRVHDSPGQQASVLVDGIDRKSCSSLSLTASAHRTARQREYCPTAPQSSVLTTG
jgi:hypothetical protein